MSRFLNKYLATFHTFLISSDCLIKQKQSNITSIHSTEVSAPTLHFLLYWKKHCYSLNYNLHHIGPGFPHLAYINILLYLFSIFPYSFTKTQKSLIFPQFNLTGYFISLSIRPLLIKVSALLYYASAR